MSPERKDTKKSRSDRPGAVVEAPVWKKLLFAIITVAILFAAVEIVLLAVGVRPVLYDEDPYVGFSSRIPLFVEQTHSGDKAIMVTAKNKLRLFALKISTKLSII